MSAIVKILTALFLAAYFCPSSFAQAHRHKPCHFVYTDNRLFIDSINSDLDYTFWKDSPRHTFRIEWLGFKPKIRLVDHATKKVAYVNRDAQALKAIGETNVLVSPNESYLIVRYSVSARVDQAYLYRRQSHLKYALVCDLMETLYKKTGGLSVDQFDFQGWCGTTFKVRLVEGTSLETVWRGYYNVRTGVVSRATANR